MPDTLFMDYGGGALDSIRGLDGSLTRGIYPSVFTLYTLPQPSLDVQGDLTFGYGSQGVQLHGCAIASANMRRNYDERHPIMAVHILDRRWKWRFSTISGDYNRRQADGTVDPATLMIPSFLATKCLQALGEANYDVSLMPTGMLPRVQWQNQRADLALQWLCDYVGCEIVYNHQIDAIQIYPGGFGGVTSDGGLTPKYSFVPRTNIPGQITVQCGPSVYESRLKLSAVARESNGQQKTISTLSYNPTWSSESPWTFPSITNNTNAQIAFEQVYRDFRVVGQQDGSLNVPNCPVAVASMDQYLLGNTLLSYETDLNGYRRNLPAYIDGDFWPYGLLCTNVSNQRYTGEVSFNTDRKLVSTVRPVFKVSSTGYSEPSLYITTSYKVRDQYGQIVSYSLSGGGSGTGTMVLRRPEIFASYNNTFGLSTESQAQAEAQAYISAFQQKFASPFSSEVRYGGFVDAPLDGTISQISWHLVANHLPTTTICENDELDTTQPSRHRKQLDRLIESMAERYL